MTQERTTHLFVAALIAAALISFWACSGGSGPTEPSPPIDAGAAGGGANLSGGTQQITGPGLDLEKATNGVDADAPPGPSIPVGDAVEWTYLVTNFGDVDLTNIAVEDDQLGTISCPKTTLAPNETMTCSAAGTAVAGQYENTGTATADDPDGAQVTDSDMSHYFGGGSTFAAIDIEKFTNGDDADFPRGPILALGDTVNWTYEVSNVGQADLSGVQVTDSQGVTVSCPASTLAVGASMTCTASDTAVAGQYVNEGQVEALDPDSNPVSDTDLSHYFGSDPSVDLEKRTNGEDADAAPGPTLFEGCTVEWTYEVTNTGNIELDNLVVTDSRGVQVSCPASTLEAGDSMTCTASGPVALGQYDNEGEVTGADPLGQQVSDTDLSHYLGMTADCAAAAAGEEILWPPNHKFVAIDILGVTDSCSVPVSLTIDSIMQDEPTNGLGDGDTSPDGRGVGTDTVEVRAERSGTGNGRVYHVGFTAADGGGSICSGEILVGVPHDKKDTPIDDGPIYDSTLP